MQHKIGQRVLMGWNAIHGVHEPGFEPHDVYVVARLGKAFFGNFFCMAAGSAYGRNVWFQ